MKRRQVARSTTSANVGELELPTQHSFPRVPSPSGLGSFLSKPSKWFTRSTSNLRATEGDGTNHRRPIISQPTDPRPIQESQKSSLSISQSYHDLSRANATESHQQSSKTNTSSSSDLAAISRKSRSVDDLSKFTNAFDDPEFTQKVHAYNQSQPVAFPTISPTVPDSPPHRHTPAPLSSIRQRAQSHTPSTTPAPSIRFPPQPGTPSKAGFSFHFGAPTISPSPTKTPENPPPALVLHSAPSVGADDGPASASNRTSQIVHHSGFLNQHPLPSAPGALSLSKGWTPRKAVLKGTKLFFFKAPRDRVNEIKLLFPTATIDSQAFSLNGPSSPLSIRPSQAVPPVPPINSAENDTPLTKKRAYWGRGRHPELLVSRDGQRVEKGGPDALLHEVAFATVFFSATKHMQDENYSESESFQQLDEEEAMARWISFATSLIVCLPHPCFMGRRKFEAGLLRRLGHLLGGESVDVGEEEDLARVSELQERARWLLRCYVSHWGDAVDHEAWEAWQTDNLNAPTEGDHDRTQDSSSRFTAPHPSAPSPASPPPPAAVGITSHSEQNPQSPSKSDKSRTNKSKVRSEAKLSTLLREGLTGEVFTWLDFDKVAYSLGVWHSAQARILASSLSSLSVGQILDAAQSRKHGPSSVTATEQATPVRPGGGSALLECFSGSDVRPHWLTRLILSQLLGNTSASVTSVGPISSTSSAASGTLTEENRVGGTGADDKHSLAQLSRTHSRAEILGRWIAVGETARIAGDQCTFMAVQCAVCSKAIARLDKVWRRVAHRERKVVEGWVCGEFTPEAKTPTSYWLGNLVDQTGDSFSRAQSLMDAEGRWFVEPLRDTTKAVEALLTLLHGSALSSDMSEDEPRGEAAALMKYWAHLSAEPVTKASQLDQHLSLSYAAEPRQKNHFSQYFWKPPNPSPIHPLLPLLFPDPLPVLTFLDRETILRSKIDWPDRSRNAPADAVLGSITEAHFQKVLKIPFPRFESRRESLDNLSVGHSNSHSELGDTFIYAFSGELILKVLPAAARSRSPHTYPSSTAPEVQSVPPGSAALTVKGPSNGLERRPSVTPSVRAAIGGSTLEKRPSTVRTRRTSLPTLSRASSMMMRGRTTDSSLRVAVSGGTLDRLVEVLLNGLEVSVSPTDDIGLSTGTARVFAIDQAEFAKTWWCTFRSFVSPYVFFELLRKRFLQSRRDVGADSSESEDGGPNLDLDIKILMILKDWILVGGGATDVLDDLPLFHGFRTFIDALFLPESLALTTTHLSPDLRERARSELARVFDAQTRRPTLNDSPEQPPQTSVLKFGSSSPDIDSISAEQFVANLDAIASTVISAITPDDLLNTTDILEVQTIDRLGWYSSRDVTTASEDIAVQNIYSLIHTIEPSSLASELSPHDTLQKSLPPSLRMLCRAQAVIRKWVTAKITEPRIGLRKREERLQLILQAIEVCRIRSSADDRFGPDTSPVTQPTIRSFVETALLAAVTSPESRTFSRAWQNVSASRNVTADSVMSMLSKPLVNPRSSMSSPPTVDGGWLLERILELVSLPDTLTGEQTLINFDKRRYIATLVNSIPRLTSPHPSSDRTHIDRMNNMLREVMQSNADFRVLREDAQRESSQITPSYGGKRHHRPFHALVSAQAEKIRRDRHAKDRLSKEKKLEQQRNERRSNDLNRAMNQPKRPSLGFGPKHERGKRSMSAFFRVVRPLSTAFSSDRLHVSGDIIRRRPSELDFIPTTKPTLVLSLNDALVTRHVNDERSFTFQLITEDGGQWLLQAQSAADLDAWMDAISRTSRKRLTYMGNGTKPQFPDIVDVTGGAADPSGGLHAVFGTSLDTLVHRENPAWDESSNAIPVALEQCLSEVERRGLSEVGIYRISGGTGAINAIRNAYNEGYFPDFETDDRYADIHAVCGAIKLFLRQLPEPVIPFHLYHEAIESSRLVDYDERSARIRTLVHSMPRVHFACLRRVMEHLDRVTDYEESNHMTAESLAICFSPSLLQPPPSPGSFAMGIGNMGPAMSFTKSLILQFHRLFDELNAEGEQDLVEDEVFEDEEIEGELGVSQEPIVPISEETLDPAAPIVLSDISPTSFGLPTGVSGITEGDV